MRQKLPKASAVRADIENSRSSARRLHPRAGWPAEQPDAADVEQRRQRVNALLIGRGCDSGGRSRGDRRRRRRRGPRERGRPDHGRRRGHPGEDRLLPRPHLRSHLRAAHSRADRAPGPAADGDGQHRGPAHGVHRERGLPPRNLDRDLRLRPGRHDQGPGRPPRPSLRFQPARPHLPAPLPARAGSSSVPATPRPQSTWPVPRGCPRPGCSARWSARTRPAWPACPS